MSSKSNIILPKLKDKNNCCGCGACIAACPQQAISMRLCEFGADMPTVNEEKCIGCKLCEKICNYQKKDHAFEKEAYIAYNRVIELRKKSASGGTFSALAAKVLERGGVVFGAEVSFEDNRLLVHHSVITDITELPRILNSKYVQSDCTAAYPLVRKMLKEGKMVLFGGTSCQVNSLYGYLENDNQTNLYTVDLICHGVPGYELFYSYVKYLEKKYKGKLLNISFRTKTNNKIAYEMVITLYEDNKTRVIKKPLRLSSYYRLFMSEESYRKACYNCQYASINKPADFTIGDYFEVVDDYPELLIGENAINIEYGINCLIIHSKKGKKLIEETENIFLKRVECEKVVNSHPQLRRRPKFKARKIFIAIYNIFGFSGLEKYIILRNSVLFIPRAIVLCFIRMRNNK